MPKGYLSLNEFLRSHFGARVQKIPLDAGLGCPNRERATGEGGCIYCNRRGSGTGAHLQGLSISEQLERGMKWAHKRYKARLFMAYFQSYSNTYGPVSRLREIYEQVAARDEIVGVAIGTRPDCIDRERLDLIQECFAGKMVWMEYGLQSSNNETLRLINRGHGVEEFISAVNLTREYPFLICAHVIFGLPGEGPAQMMETIDLVGRLEVDGIKFHQLYVVRDTPLERLYREGRYIPLTQEEYAMLVSRAIRQLPSKTVIQRLTGDPAPGELVAPLWARDKQQTIKLIHELLGEG